MSYVSANLTCMTQAAGPIGCKLWVYDSADAATSVDAAGYISDAKVRGMEKGDIVITRTWTTAAPTTTAEKQTADGTANDLLTVYLQFCIGISTAGAADLSNGLAITETNSD